jgi:hypothetical protein
MPLQFPRGTEGIITRAYELVRFARRYNYSALLDQRLNSACAIAVTSAIAALIAALDQCDADPSVDPEHRDPTPDSPEDMPDDTEGGE